MRIAISQRVVPMEKRASRDALDHDYVQYYSSLGATLIPVPNVLPDVGAYLSELAVEAIILSGGNDVDPALYGSTASQDSSHSVERDRTDGEILRFAEVRRLPVLAECRGMQFMNVYFGGKLRKVPGHVDVVHEVKCKNLTVASGAEQKERVNSYHSFGITQPDLAPVLNPFAFAADGVIEGVAHQILPIVGIMWHPERRSPNEEYNTTLVHSFFRRELFWRSR